MKRRKDFNKIDDLRDDLILRCRRNRPYFWNFMASMVWQNMFNRTTSDRAIL